MDATRGFHTDLFSSVEPKTTLQGTSLDQEVKESTPERPGSAPIPVPLPDPNTSLQTPITPQLTKQDMESLLQDTLQRELHSVVSNFTSLLNTALEPIKQQLERIENANRVLRHEVGLLRTEHGMTKTWTEETQNRMANKINELTQTTTHILEQEHRIFARVLQINTSTEGEKQIQEVPVFEEPKPVKKQPKKKKKKKPVKVESEEEEESEEESEEETYEVVTKKRSGRRLAPSAPLPTHEGPLLPVLHRTRTQPPVEGPTHGYQQTNGGYGPPQLPPRTGFQQPGVGVDVYNQPVYGNQLQPMENGFQAVNVQNERVLQTPQQQYPPTPSSGVIQNYNPAPMYAPAPSMSHQSVSTAVPEGSTTQMMGVNQVIDDVVGMGYDRSMATAAVTELLKQGDGRRLDMNDVFERLTKMRYGYW